MTLVWNKCQGGAWCPFMTVDLTHSHFQGMEGVYVIWHGGPNPRTVYVGSGKIAERIQAHRTNANIIRHQADGGLFVTWARVPASQQLGVESYLIKALLPFANEVAPTAAPITANHPWG